VPAVTPSCRLRRSATVFVSRGGPAMTDERRRSARSGWSCIILGIGGGAGTAPSAMTVSGDGPPPPLHGGFAASKGSSFRVRLSGREPRSVPNGSADGGCAWPAPRGPRSVTALRAAYFLNQASGSSRRRIASSSLAWRRSCLIFNSAAAKRMIANTTIPAAT